MAGRQDQNNSEFGASIALPPIPDLRAEVWTLVGQIPTCRVSTYGAIARALGDVEASRFVGEVMMQHDHQDGCPCHRVVRADGALGKFISGDAAAKASLLRADSISVRDGRVPLAAFGWTDFQSHSPLTALSGFQTSVAEAAHFCDTIESIPTVVGGVDVSYAPKTNIAVAAYAEVDLVARQPRFSMTRVARIRFPYVPTYLAFRELPLLATLLKDVRAERSLPEVIVVDGSGVLHPRGTGIATMLGVLIDWPTVGITKKRLTGKVDLDGMTEDSCRAVRIGDALAGFAILPGSGTTKPWYVSAGHKLDAVTALAVAQSCRLNRRLAEPIFWADKISREAARSFAQQGVPV